MSNPVYLTAGAVLVLTVFTLLRQRSIPRERFPPGPQGQFLVGNLADIPSGGYEWDAYGALGKRCGNDVVYMKALGSHLLVLNSFEAARDLLDKKGALYSSRPRLVMINELMGWDWNLILMPYGRKFQAYRRAVQQEFQAPVVAQSYRTVMSRETVALLDRLSKSPESVAKHMKQMAAATIMMVTYGHQVTSADDEFVALAEAVREHSEKTPASNLVDVIPLLKFVPAWFPGAEFKRRANFARQLSMDMRSAPFKAVKKQMSNGTAKPSMVSRILQSGLSLGEDSETEDDFAQNCGGVVYSAGADTTVAALLNFVLAMTLYPDVQARAHEELDRVVGRDRLPSFEDRARLPYIANIVRESLRWKAVSPLGVPHSAMEDDEYRGWHIPKGTTVIANIAAMLHDESVYKDPHTFKPERYDPTPENPTGEPDPVRAAFGFGRRICPGRFFAEDAVWFAIAAMLHVFAIRDPTARRDVSQVRWCSGLVSLPSDFPYEMVPRFASARDLAMLSE
ncbi:cytochrome P450 [Earliella scabrosa]|nr:cytochrome P450 [Earliella scabrosa]